VLRRRVRAHRRLLAALLLGLAVLAGLRAVAPPPPATVTVVVAARDLPAGARLGADDLATERLPVEFVPDGTDVRPRGRVLAAGVRRGEVLTDARLVTGSVRTADPHSTALPVRLPDAGAASLLAPGDEVDLWATDPRSGETRAVAGGVRVLAVPQDVAEGPTGTQSGALVVLEVETHRVPAVTGAALSEFLSVTL
jgi:Flp pilus assembly protein CpaB